MRLHGGCFYTARFVARMTPVPPSSRRLTAPGASADSRARSDAPNTAARGPNAAPATRTWGETWSCTTSRTVGDHAADRASRVVEQPVDQPVADGGEPSEIANRLHRASRACRTLHDGRAAGDRTDASDVAARAHDVGVPGDYHVLQVDAQPVGSAMDPAATHQRGLDGGVHIQEEQISHPASGMP
jgi:hypothetical protein